VSTRPYFRANLFEKLGGHIYEGRNLFPRNLLYLCGLIIKNMEAKHIAQETIVPHNQRYENEGYTDWEIFLLNHDPFTSRFSLLAENLWKQDLKNLLLPWGIVINSTCYRMDGTRNGKSYHFDVIGRSDKEIIITCIREHLTFDEIAEFELDLFLAKDIFRNEPVKPIYGAVVFITAEDGSHSMAEKLGFFVIKATGSSSSVVNSTDFIPKVF